MIRRNATLHAVSIALAAALLAPSIRADAQRTPQPVVLGPGATIRNVEDPFEYFSNPWTVIGLKDYVDGARISPKGEWVLADGLLCRPLVGASRAPLNRRVRKTLRDGYLPIVRSDFILNESTRYTIESFATPLESEGAADRASPSEENFANLVRITVTNPGKSSTRAHFALQWQPKKGRLVCALGAGAEKKAVPVVADDRVLCVLRLPETANVTAEGSRVTVAVNLAGGSSSSIVARIPYRSIPRSSSTTLRVLGRMEFDACADRQIAFWNGLLERGAQLEVPEDKPQQTYKASMVNQFIGRDKGDVHPGEGFYDNLYIRDGAYQAISLAHAGYLDAARESLEFFFPFQRDDGQFVSQKGQLDAHGYAIWAFVEYYRLSRDTEWLRRVYPRIKKAAEWTRKARRREKDTASPFFGVLPAAPADGENLWDGKNHIVGYDWWNLRGIQSAADAARALGKNDDATLFDREFEAYRNAIRKAFEKTGLPYIPPSYEKDGTHWGNLEAIFPSILIDPRDARLSATLEYVRNEFGGGFREGTIQWSPPKRGAIHPYMSQFVTNSHIIRGEYEKAVDGFYWFLLHTTAANGFPEGVYYQRREAWNNTLPHLWAAGLYVTTLRNMLLREQGDTLHLLSCAPRHWLDAGKRIRVEMAPTHFGAAGFTVDAGRDILRLLLRPPRRNAPRKIVIHVPRGVEIESARAQNRPARVDDRRTVILDGGIASEFLAVTIRVSRTAKGPGRTFDSTVAEYQSQAAHLLKPIPGLVSRSTIGQIDGRNCVKIDLSRFAVTDPLAAPFNVPNPGRYIFDGLPLGDRTVSGVPFRIIDPAANGGKGLVVLNGANACREFARVIDVPVGVQGRFLCVLGNVTGWAGSDPGVGEWGAIGEYEIGYADGTTQTIPLISGRTVDDWAESPIATEVAVALRAGAGHLNLLAIELRPKPVTSVRIRDMGTPASPVVAAMTIVK